jgi:cytoskeletal protein CcmA (bactofilin family)
MAVGRISGPLLKSNLIRNGIDLAFETDLLYLDVNNQRIGIKNSSPEHELDVTGTTRTTDLIVTNRADLADVTVEGNTISTTQPFLNLATLDTVVALNKIRIDSIDIEGNAITTNDSNANLEFRPNGTGAVNVHSNLNVDGNIYASGNITADGNITIGDANTDNVIFNADVSSNIIPDIDDNYTLGSDPTAGGKQWNDVFVNNLRASSLIVSDNLDVGNIDFTLTHGNIYYVAENGDDANVGNHIFDPFASVKYALSVAVAGDTIIVSPGDYTEEFPITIPQGVTLKGEGIRAVTIRPTVATNTNDAVLLNGETTVEDLTITGFYSPGYAFKYATGYTATSRSPYVRNVTVITEGSVTSPTDPRGFNEGDAGKGVFLDGAVATSSSVNTALLFHSVTFITPGVDAVVLTNGARVEWLNSFTYFANRSMYAYDSPQGRRNAGLSKVTLSGVTGTFTAGNTLTITSADASTVLTGTIDSVDGNDVYVQGYLDFDGFDLTPQSITDGTATATTIDSFDLREFGAEVRLIASASVYGNFGLVGQGPGVIMYAIGHNLAYIGNGKETTNDPNTVIQANEIVESESARIRYNSVDHKGDFRVGDLFYVNQETGNVTFAVSDFEINTENGVTFNTNGDTTFIDGTKIETGDWRISGNTVETLTQDANFEGGSGIVNLNSDVNVTGSLDVTGNVTIGGNITIGDEETDTIEIIAGIDSDINPKVASTYNLGTSAKTWKNLFVDVVNLDNITITDNYIATTQSNSDLELRANGTGEIYVPSNNVQIDNDLTVSGVTTLANTNITGTITHVGDYNQTGNYTITGTISNGNIQIAGNVVETTSSNSDLELRANGIGEIYVPDNNVQIDNDLTVSGVTDLQDTNVTGTITHTGNVNQVGNFNIAGAISNGNINIAGNVIEATTSNSDLELRANGTGEIYIPDNNVQIDNDLTVSGVTDLQDTNVTGTITHVGDTLQTGDATVTGNVTVTQDLDVTGAAQFEEILVDDNYITTTTSNADLELRATGTGEILIPNNDVQIVNDLTVDNDINANNLTTTGLITANSFTTGDIVIDDNFIQTTQSNSDLDLRANGTGVVSVPSNDIVIDENLTVAGSTSLQDVDIQGNLTQVGNTTQTGNINLTGNFGITGNITISSTAQFEDIKIEDNFITTTESNSDLELRATEYGVILIPSNDVAVTNNLNVAGVATVNSLSVVESIISNTYTTGDLLLDDNFITTTQSNSNLELRANGVGEILVPTNDVVIEQDLTVNGTTTLKNTTIVGDITHTGNVTQVGDITLTGNLDVDGDVIISATVVQFEDIQVSGNRITTTLSDSNLELRANGIGEIYVPSNDVVIEQDLSVNGTISVNNINASGTITANSFTTGDILIDDNFITTTTSNSNLELRANGTGSIIIDTFDINGSTVASSSDFIIQPGSGILNINATGALKLPTGDTSERPTAVAGQIRYNTDLNRFEGYNGTNWVNLKGVEDLDGNTKVTAELSEGANDGIIRFNIQGSTIARIDSTKLTAPRIDVADIRIDGNVIETTTEDTDLNLTANGTGTVKFDNFAFKDNTITNTVTDSVTIFQNTGNGYVKFDGNYGIVLPSGGTGSRPPFGTAEIGQTRYNTDDSRVEIWNGSNWVSVAGEASGITRSDAEEIALSTVLVLG